MSLCHSFGRDAGPVLVYSRVTQEGGLGTLTPDVST